MGLFKLFKKQLLTVIEWKDNNKETIVYRYPLKEREEIMNSSTLVVRPSQVAVFVHKGEICDIFKPGTYKLTTENIPIITKLAALPTGFNSPIKAEVYFINTKQIIGQKWGTQNPVMLRDKDFGNVRIRAFGIYNFQVENVKNFMEQVFGTNETYAASDIAVQIRPLIVQSLTDAIAESKISALDLATQYNEFAEEIVKAGKEKLSTLGVKITSITIENISLPEEVEKALDERTKLGVLEDKMGTFTQYQAAKALRDSAQNTSGGNLAGMGVGLGAGVGLGKVFGDALSSAKNTDKKADTAHGTTCPNCNAVQNGKAKFCSECGAKLPKSSFCPNCGKEIAPNSKFCPECGEKLK